MIYYCFVFFLYCYRHHLDLHSFPTRRSSDLSRPREKSAESKQRRQHIRRLRLPRTSARRRSFPASRSWKACGERTRSEEHTSELQSRLHLVCRLLLEKKKKKKHQNFKNTCEQ